MQRYREIEHTADLCVEIYGDTLTMLFVNAGYALFDQMIEVDRVTPTLERALTVTGEQTEMLLINWLRELFFLFSVHGEVYCEFRIDALSANSVTALVKGEPLNLAKHAFKTELKAVTYHQFAVFPDADGWCARVLFDV